MIATESEPVSSARMTTHKPIASSALQALEAAMSAAGVAFGRMAGGQGSGNFGHAGRPGEIGGSAADGTAPVSGGGSPDVSGKVEDYPPARPDGLDTRERFRTLDGRYTHERQALHQRIVAKYLAGRTPVDHPTATVLGGGMASGKTTLVDAQGLDQGNVVMVNVDEIRKDLPEYDVMIKAGDKSVGNVTHEESSDISKMLLDTAARGQYNILMDGSGDSTVSKLGAKVAVMRQGGHEVNAAYVTLPVISALKLAESRGQKTGRYVPETLLRENHRAVSNTFQEAVRQGMFDKAELYDTRVRGQAVRVMSGGRNQPAVIHDQALWDEFVGKGA